MRRVSRAWTSGWTLLYTVLAPTAWAKIPNAVQPEAAPIMKHAPSVPADSEKALVRQVRGMTLAQKAGQVLMLGFDGVTVTAELGSVIADLHPGGLVLFERNVGEGPSAVAALTAGAQAASAAAGDPPLFLSIDQEGGAVTRLRATRGFTEFPSAMAVAATGDDADAGRIGSALAEELLTVGVNMDLAPSLDVNVNASNPVIGTRSFGSDPARVGALGARFIEAMQARGMPAVGKHFPGHGDTAIDSHVRLPVIAHDRARLEAVEFAPFRAAIQVGVAGIMSAHIAFPAIDPAPALPATLSRKALTGLLRQEMGYNGLIFTDSLIMGALVNEGRSIPQAAAQALMAGADVLLFNSGHGLHRAAHAEIVAGVNSGRIPTERLDDAVLRILSAKADYGLLGAPRAAPDLMAGQAGRRALAREVSARAITLVRDWAGCVPIRDPDAVVVIETPQATGMGRALGAPALSVSAQPTADEIGRAVEAARDRKVVVGTSDVLKNPRQADLVKALLASGTPVIVVAVRLPYDLLHFDAAPTYLATYQASEDAFAALAEILLGRRLAVGQMPVGLL